MSSKLSKSERKEDRIQQLERELSETKKKLKNQSKVVRLDEEQISDYLEQLTERIAWSTNRMVDQTTPPCCNCTAKEKRCVFTACQSLAVWVVCGIWYIRLLYHFDKLVNNVYWRLCKHSSYWNCVLDLFCLYHNWY